MANRFRFQYSLRGALLATAALCLWLGFTVDRARKQEAAVAAIMAAGGQVRYDGDDGSYTEAELRARENPPIFRRGFGRHLFSNVTCVSFAYTDCDDSALERLKSLRTNEELWLSYTSITGDGLAILRHQPELRRLSLKGTRITDEALRHLAPLEHLEVLELSWTPVHGQGFQHLRHLGHLRRLDLSCSEITNDGLRHVSGLAHLESLDISLTEVTDAGIGHLANLRNLQELTIAETDEITEGALSELQRALPRVRIEDPFGKPHPFGPPFDPFALENDPSAEADN